MLVSTQMITGFNTDVKYEGHVYHVQTEDRGKENPILESLVYVGGTIVAKKLTSYSDQLVEGAGEDAIAALLKRQHQVVIAAIKAGRIEELISHTRRQHAGVEPRKKRATGALAKAQAKSAPSSPKQSRPARTVSAPPPAAVVPGSTPTPPRSPGSPEASAPASVRRGDTGGLNLDSVIADYMKRSSGEARLDVKVVTPDVFTAGKNVGLRVQVTRESRPEFEAIVTVKIIGTAFKPQVFIGRVGGDGVAAFSLALPAFTTGTAAIVIEAQSSRGRGELKKLIRRA
ncbi:MAG TPA: hypothetical protein VLM38_03575 [Blastocatellia bacterium]|nr:hypothetical protein [Blastocatellia bacterium]